MDNNYDESNVEEIMNSPLLSTKKLLGYPIEDHSFDVDILMNINAALTTLYQLGVIERPSMILSEDDTYDIIFSGAGPDIKNLAAMYFLYKTKLAFDSSTMSASVIEVTNKLIAEAEFRLMASYNPKGCFETKDEIPLIPLEPAEPVDPPSIPLVPLEPAIPIKPDEDGGENSK